MRFIYLNLSSTSFIELNNCKISLRALSCVELNPRCAGAPRGRRCWCRGPAAQRGGVECGTMSLLSSPCARPPPNKSTQNQSTELTNGPERRKIDGIGEGESFAVNGWMAAAAAQRNPRQCPRKELNGEGPRSSPAISARSRRPAD
jgi:hypothetical protein